MKCNDCKNEMHQLFDADADSTLTIALKQHVASCKDCSSEYDEMKNVFALLQPKTKIVAPLSLKQNIFEQIKNEKIMNTNTAKKVYFNKTFKRILSAAAIIIAIMLVIPFIGKNDHNSSSSIAAETLFSNSIKATGLIKNMRIKFSVRTDAKDNFDLIGKNFEMVEHTLIKTFDKPEKWRIEKSGRMVVCDGSNQYLWKPETKEAIKGPLHAGFVEWMRILLDPYSILSKEKENAKDNNSKITTKESADKLLVTITSNAQGNFINDYLKNKSVLGSDNRREYIFDNKTKLLKGLKIYLLENKTETLILNIENIDYDVTIDTTEFTIVLPDGVEWKEINLAVTNETFSNISSKRAAEIIFDNLAKKDFDSNKEVWTQFNFVSLKMIDNKYGGLQVLKIGESFKSGDYPGEFIPYKIKLSNGEIKEHNLALRNDNPNKVWVVDGGL